MVGVPRSKGCLQCIKLRVKCDETKPSCARCTRLSHECVYTGKHKFVLEIPREENIRAAGQGSFHHVRELARPAERRRSQSTIPSTRDTTNASAPRHVPASVIEPTFYDTQKLTIFIQSSTPADMCTDVHFMKKWLRCIPARLGRSEVLDLAVRCLANHYVGTLSGSGKATARSQKAYGAALVSLQRAIEDPVQGLAQETMCATMVMSLYEHYACTGVHSWVMHAGGAARLAQIRGSHRQMDHFDRTMMWAFRYKWIMEAFMNRAACFLDDPEWLSYFDPVNPESDPKEAVSLINEFFGYLVKAPGLTVEGYVLKAKRLRGQLGQDDVPDYLRRVHEVSFHLRNWFQRFSDFFGPPKEVPSRTNDLQSPTVYDYGGLSLCYPSSYYATLIVMNSNIRHFETSETLEAEVDHSVKEICKSVEYAYTCGIFGPAEIAFGLRMAFMEADLDTRIWIKNHIDRMADIIPLMRYQVSMDEKVVLFKKDLSLEEG